MNMVDGVLIVVVIFSVLRGLWRGAVSQLFGIAGFVAGFFVAHRFGAALGNRLATSFPSLPHSTAMAAALLFFLTWFLIALAGAWISHGLRRGGLGGTDRMVGGALGLVKGGLGMLLMVWILTLLMPPDHKLLKHSRLIPYAQEATRLLVDATPKSFRERLKILPRRSPGKNITPPGVILEKKHGEDNEPKSRSM
ncbi:membrane protein required for colicin V production [Desulfosoma caldarium]|uniref:Membrane protein required for colicin V production n=2 Tax=Desulfosoma caldarium TaxID=610254 RepID=A0A3N1VJR9_9BACT|nr:membrane protein required for colicin V production [Desulfosoma caldarium]